MKKMYLFVSILVTAVMLLTACGPAATTAPVATQPPAPTATQPPAPTATQPPTAIPPTATKAPTAVPTPIPAPICDPLPDAMPAPKAGELGAFGTPITMAFVPSGESGVIAKSSSAIAACLDKMTGLTYAVQTGTSYAAAIEAMGAGKAQVGFLNTFSILIAEAKYKIIPAMINLRNYQTNDLDSDKALGNQLEPFYKAQFITTATSGIKTYADLKGKTFCFVDPLSTSGYIVPRIILKANGIDPDKDFASTTNAGSHQNVASSVYKGDCDAGVTFINVLTDATLNKTYPDIQTKLVVFADSDRIPNDGVQYIKTLDPKIQAITTEALLAMAKDPGGKVVLAKLYTINAFQKLDPSMTYYADFQKVLQKAGVDPTTMVK